MSNTATSSAAEARAAAADDRRAAEGFRRLAEKFVGVPTTAQRMSNLDSYMMKRAALHDWLAEQLEKTETRRATL